MTTAPEILAVVLINPVEFTATSVVVPVAFNVAVLTTAPEILAVVLINPVEFIAPAVVVPLTVNELSIPPVANILADEFTPAVVVRPVAFNVAVLTTAAEILALELRNPASVTVPVAFNAPVFTTAALTFAVVLMKPVEFMAAAVVVLLTVRVLSIPPAANTLPVTFNAVPMIGLLKFHEVVACV